VSKESRRRQRQAGQVPAAGPTPTRASGGTAAQPSRSSSPSGTARAGRRERSRPVAKASFFQRYRTLLLAAAILVIAVIVGAGVFSQATQAAYACSNTWVPDPTSPPAEGASPQPGFVQPDMGHSHVPTGTKITYTYCPPASGRHYQQPAAPIPARVYGPDDAVIPQQWIHNLEHGGLVILYRDTNVDQAALQAVFDAVGPSPVCGFPPGGQSPGPLVARFKDMSWPYAALVWGRVLPLETLDQAAILDFYAIWGEKTNPEPLCTPPSAAPSDSSAPSGSVAPSPNPSPSASGASTAPSSSASPASSESTAPSAPASASPS